MQVKKFEAATMAEALKVIKRELGPEAVILSTKHIKSGFGLMSKASVEVTAAVAIGNPPAPLYPVSLLAVRKKGVRTRKTHTSLKSID